MTSLSALFSAREWFYAVAIAAVVAVLTFLRADAAARAVAEGKLRREEDSEDIRHRVSVDLPDRLREFENSGYRD